jgi:hypothetical protein
MMVYGETKVVQMVKQTVNWNILLRKELPIV